MLLKSSSKDFEVLNKLGQGSFGTVFKVRRKADKNFYVMKSINISQMDRRGQQESVNEVKILASLDNPYIVKYFDSFIENKTLNIVMEFCDKGDLSQNIRAQMGRLIIESKIWKFFIQMCLGLEYIHSKRILHRDIKSMNVFLIRDDCVRIGDLGVAKVLANTAAFAHTMVGTPYYLSPELCEEKPYNVKSDVWALGCVLYELCTLKHPFDALNQAALLLKIIKGSYAPTSSSYSAELREVVDLCLCKDYRKRPNIQGILNRPGMKERALGLNILIPGTSVIAGAAVAIPKEPALVYQSQMAVIEEEKVGLKQAKAPERVGHSPANARAADRKKEGKPDGKNYPVVKPGGNEAKLNDIRANKEERRSVGVLAEKEKDPKNFLGKNGGSDGKAGVKEGKGPVIQTEREVRPKAPEKIEKEIKAKAAEKIPERPAEKPGEKEIKKQEFIYADMKNLQYKQIENKEKEKIDAKEAIKAKNSADIQPHFNNIQFEPPVNLGNKVNNPKINQNAIKFSPRNMAMKLENKLNHKNELLKIINKSEIKPTPNPETKQKVVKSGIQPPHFMPPQRPQDIKPAKKDPEPSKITPEMKQVQDLPDYPRAKKPSISILKPALIKFEIKKFEILVKPDFEVLNVFDPFSDTIDWNFTQTGFRTKEFIPVTSHNKEEVQEFQVNYARNGKSEEEVDENDDELYLVSDSESEEETSANNEFNEDYEGENGNAQERLVRARKELAEAERMIDIRTQEIVGRVGQKTFQEMYFFFKEKANVSNM